MTVDALLLFQPVLVDQRDAERVDPPARLGLLCVLHGARDRPVRRAERVARQLHDDRHPRLFPGPLPYCQSLVVGFAGWKPWNAIERRRRKKKNEEIASNQLRGISTIDTHSKRTINYVSGDHQTWYRTRIPLNLSPKPANVRDTIWRKEWAANKEIWTCCSSSSSSNWFPSFHLSMAIRFYRFVWPCRRATTRSAATRSTRTTAGWPTTCAAFRSACWPFTFRASTTLSGVIT